MGRTGIQMAQQARIVIELPAKSKHGARLFR